MSSIIWLNKFLFLENLLGIYRTYCSQKNIKKCFIMLHILIQTILQTIILFVEVDLVIGDGFNQINYIYSAYSVSAYVTAVPAVVTGICNSRAFVSFYGSLSRVSGRFKNDLELNNSLKKTYWLSIIKVFAYVTAVGVLRFVEVLIKLAQTHPIAVIPIVVAQITFRMTIVLQYLMFFVVTMTVVLLIKCLNSLVSEAQERVARCDINSDEQCDITREQIQEWVELYRDLANCCEKVTLCFGHQFFFLLLLLLLYFILLTLQFCHWNFIYGEDTHEYKKIAFILFIYTSLVIAPLIAGQMASNQGLKFRRALVRLYNTMITHTGACEAKSIKDFIRLIKKNPIEVKILSSITAGMYMLPVMLTLAVSNLIVILQFNHVI